MLGQGSKFRAVGKSEIQGEGGGLQIVIQKFLKVKGFAYIPAKIGVG